MIRFAREHGFVLPIALMLLTLAALLVVDALRAATASESQAVATRLRLRAFEAAETGLAHAEMALRTGDAVAAAGNLALDDAVTASVSTRLIEVDTLPAGYSANRVQVQRFRVQSTGRAPRGAQLELELGLARRVGAP